MAREDAYASAKKSLRLGIRAFVQAMIEVNGQMRLSGGGKCVAMEAGAARGCQFRAHVVLRQRNRVVAGMIHFIDARRLDICRVKRACDGSYQDIAVLARGAAEVKMAETKDAPAAEIAEAGRTAIEALHIRAELHHAEGHGRADKGTAAPVHAEKWINIVNIVLRRAGAGFRGLARQSERYNCAAQ